MSSTHPQALLDILLRRLETHQWVAPLPPCNDLVSVLRSAAANYAWIPNEDLVLIREMVACIRSLQYNSHRVMHDELKRMATASNRLSCVELPNVWDCLAPLAQPTVGTWNTPGAKGHNYVAALARTALAALGKKQVDGNIYDLAKWLGVVEGMPAGVLELTIATWAQKQPGKYQTDGVPSNKEEG